MISASHFTSRFRCYPYEVDSALSRAVDQDSHGLDILVQRRRDKAAAKESFRRPLKSLPDVSRLIITDQLKSYGAAT